MMVKVFDTDKNGKISFSKEELEKLLNEIYSAGYWDGKNSTYIWTYPSPIIYGNE